MIVPSILYILYILLISSPISWTNSIILCIIIWWWWLEIVSHYVCVEWVIMSLEFYSRCRIKYITYKCQKERKKANSVPKLVCNGRGKFEIKAKRILQFQSSFQKRLRVCDTHTPIGLYFILRVCNIRIITDLKSNMAWVYTNEK